METVNEKAQNICYSCKGAGSRRKREKVDGRWGRFERECKACGGCGVIERRDRKKKRVRKSYPSFVAPGPYPVGDHGNDSSLQEQVDEELSYLVGNWRIFQKLGRHRYSTDDLVTSWVACREARRLQFTQPLLLDIGCGLGSVLLCNAWQFPDATCVGVEAQEDRFQQAVRSVAYNVGHFPLEQRRIRVLQHDLRDDNPHLTANYPQGFDMITGTPPYFAPHLAGQPGCPETAGCLFELRGGVEEYCTAAAMYLRKPATTALPAPGQNALHSSRSSPDEPPLNEHSAPSATSPSTPSVFILCNTALASSRVYLGCEAAGMSIVRRLDVIPREGKSPLFCVFVMVLNTWLNDDNICSSGLFPPLTPISPHADLDYSSGGVVQSLRSIADLLPDNATDGVRVEGSLRGEECEELTIREADLKHTIEYAAVLKHLGKPSSFDKEKFNIVPCGESLRKICDEENTS